MKYIALFSRTVLGLVFIFSGFVKAVDPLGSAYKFMDYFMAFNIEWLDPIAVVLSVALSALEFIIGAALFFGLKNKISAWGGLLFMVFFTPLTLYLALKNPVSDCGCFGDAIILTNWETFYKNLIILVFAIITFLWRRKFAQRLSCKVQWLLIALLLIVPVGISVYGLNHLPIIDFRAWKVGNSMKMDPNIVDKYYVTYQNKETGELKEYLSPDFPWDDSTWVATWEFVDQRIEAAPRPHNLIYITDANGEDYSKMLTQNPDFQFLLVMYYLDEANMDDFDEIKDFAASSFDNGVEFAAVTGSTPDEVSEFIAVYEPGFELYFADEIVLKTVIRSNPGLVLIKDGTILAKWHHNDIPDYDEVEFEKLENKFLKKE